MFKIRMKCVHCFVSHYLKCQKGHNVKFNPGTLQKLVRYIQLVYTDLREAYLVDCCHFRLMEMIDILHSMASYFKFDIMRLIIIIIGDDLLITTKNVVQSKLYLFESNISIVELSEKSPPIVMSLERSTSFLRNLANLLLSHSTQQLGMTVYSLSEDEIDKADFPVLAGWLLGYPSVYKISSHVPAFIGDSVIQFATVVHFDCSSTKCGKCNKASELNQMDLMEFTVPTLLEDFVLESGLEEGLARRVDSLQRLASSSILPPVQTITLSRKTFPMTQRFILWEGAKNNLTMIGTARPYIDRKLLTSFHLHFDDIRYQVRKLDLGLDRQFWLGIG